MDKLAKVRAEVERIKTNANKRGAISKHSTMVVCDEILSLIDSLQEEPSLSNDEQKVSNAYCRKLREKRVLPTLKGDLKHKFLNEFNTLYQTLDMQLCDRCMKEPLKELCLDFATWGAYNLKHIGGISKEEITKMDSLQEEPVSEELEEAIDTYLKSYWGGEKEKQDWPFLKKMAIYFAQWQKEKDESTTEDLGEYINELSKQFPEVSFAKLSRIAVRVAKWQKEQFEKNRLAHCDAQTEEEAEIESDFVMGIIEKEHRQPTFDDAIKYGMRLQKEQMMAKAIDGIARPYDNEIWCILDSFNLKDGDKVKVIVIKED